MNTLRDKHDIFELIGSSHNAYHSAVLTCYTFDPIFFNTYFMLGLRRCGITNIVVFVDATRYDELMQQYLLYSEELNSMHYTVVRQKASGNGAFHPKMIYLSGEDKAMMFVGSGNLTFSGYAVNQEIWSVFSLHGENSIYAPIIIEGWRFLKGIYSNNSQLVDLQLKWIEENSQWMSKTKADKSGTVELADGTSYTMLYNNKTDSIFSQVIARLRSRSIKSIKIVSPFYDKSGDLIASLQRELTPESIYCVIDKHGTYPLEILHSKQSWAKFYEWGKAYGGGATTLLHGKLLQFETDKDSFLLIGSANATGSAFGLISGHFNDEVSILIHSKSHVDYLAELGLRFDAPITFEEAKSLSEPLHTSNTNKQNYKVYIEAAEVIGNRLSIKLSHACKECAIVLEQPSINSVEQYPIRSNNCEIKVTVPRILPGAIVHLTQNGKPISNKIVVILDDVVSMSNPNKRLRDIQSLLNSNCTWQNRIEELVSYMYFEDEISTPSIQKHISSPSASNKQSKSISVEDFDKIEFKQKQQILNNPNVLIAEFLTSGIQSLRSLSSSDDDIDSYENVDSGTIKEQSSKKHTEEPIDDIKYIKSILRYVNKFINNGLLAKLKSFNEGCKDGMLGEITYQGVAINDFSHCAVALILINDIIQNKRAYIDQEHYHKIKAFATTLIGSFSILHRESLECDGSYRQLKMQDFTKAILLYALNVISTFTWAGEDKNTENLLVMNLLDLCKRDISCCVELYRKLKGKQAVSIDVNLCRIRQRYEPLIKSYMEFTRKENGAHIKEFGLYFKSGLMYKQKYGFLHIDFLRRAKDNLRVFAVSHPAFDKPKEMKNGDKYVAVHI